MAPPKQHVAVRIAVELVARIDALIPRLTTRWHEAKRSDVLRAILLIGLDVVEANPSVLGRPPGGCGTVGAPCSAPSLGARRYGSGSGSRFPNPNQNPNS